MTLVLPDTSVWARRDEALVSDELAHAIERNLATIVTPIMLELLRSTRDKQEWLTQARQYAALHQIRLTADIEHRAVVVQAALAARGYHRGPSPTDLIAAAAAEAVGAELWHCDRHFELIAQVTGQPMRRLGA